MSPWWGTSGYPTCTRKKRKKKQQHKICRIQCFLLSWLAKRTQLHICRPVVQKPSASRPLPDRLCSSSKLPRPRAANVSSVERLLLLPASKSVALSIFDLSSFICCFRNFSGNSHMIFICVFVRFHDATSAQWSYEYVRCIYICTYMHEFRPSFGSRS